MNYYSTTTQIFFQSTPECNFGVHVIHISNMESPGFYISPTIGHPEWGFLNSPGTDGTWQSTTTVSHQISTLPPNSVFICNHLTLYGLTVRPQEPANKENRRTERKYTNAHNSRDNKVAVKYRKWGKPVGNLPIRKTSCSKQCVQHPLADEILDLPNLS